MFTTNTHSFFERRLKTLLNKNEIREYHEDYERGMATFTIVHPAMITDVVINKIRMLFNAKLVTLTAVGGSLNIMVYGVVFQYTH